LLLLSFAPGLQIGAELGRAAVTVVDHSDDNGRAELID
jgi:hypothetical protein